MKVLLAALLGLFAVCAIALGVSYAILKHDKYDKYTSATLTTEIDYTPHPCFRNTRVCSSSVYVRVTGVSSVYFFEFNCTVGDLACFHRESTPYIRMNGSTVWYVKPLNSFSGLIIGQPTYSISNAVGDVHNGDVIIGFAVVFTVLFVLTIIIAQFVKIRHSDISNV